jgi:DNA polymerase-3 subunit delta
MLVEFLGTNLSKINNELEKLQIILPIGSLITKDIEENIGFSKDFNVFELRKAIGERNQLKAYTIAENFANNPKENPWWLPLVYFGFFLSNC